MPIEFSNKIDLVRQVRGICLEDPENAAAIAAWTEWRVFSFEYARPAAQSIVAFCAFPPHADAESVLRGIAERCKNKPKVRELGTGTLQRRL